MKNILDNNKKVGKLTFKADDDLSKRLNKLINFVYKNYGEIDKKELKLALSEKYGADDFVSVNEKNIYFESLKKTYEYCTKFDITENSILYSKELDRYLLVSKENKFNKRYNEGLRYFTKYPECKFYSVNEKTLIGVHLIQKDIFDKVLTNNSFKYNSIDEIKEFLGSFLKGLSKGAYYTDIDYILFIKDEAKKNLYLNMYNIIDMYVNTAYQYKLQYDYEKSIDKVIRATAWTTKKTINEKTKKAMESTSLNKLYKFVELDNDVDLDKMAMFESEMAEIKNKLPRFENEKQATLRLRKLGNYKALGMYVPANNTIAIDFRDGGDTDVMNYDEAGIQSFVHEYGHFIDYRSSDGRLSDKDEFYKMAKTYTENLEKFAMKNKNNHVSKKLGYYLTPTEIFARGFELFMRSMGLETSLMHDNKVYDNEPEYTAFNQEEVLEYYSGIFPEFKVS